MRHVSIVVLFVMFASLVAACGGDEAEPTQAPSGTAEVTPAGADQTPTAVAETPAVSTATPEASDEPQVGGSEPTTTPAAESDTANDGFAYGFNIAWAGDEHGAPYNEQAHQAVQDAGFNWVRIQIRWAEVERAKNQWDPLPIDRFLETYADGNVKILGSVVEAPDWAKDPTGEQFLSDYADWEGFMHFLAERYRGRIHAWEIWNEQNIAANVGGEIRISDYARLLQAGYSGAKKADPEATIVFGGLTPTGVNDPALAVDDVNYLEQFYLYEGGRYVEYFDVMGIHTSATNNPPDTMWPENPGPGGWSDDPSFYFRRGEQLRQVMVANGDQRPVWITEFGWTTANQQAGYEYGADVSEEDQAEYLVRAFEIAREEWGWVEGMFVWNLNFSSMTTPEDEKYPWAVLNEDWSPRPAYEALRDMPKS